MGERVWLTKSAYLKLKGQEVAHYIEATPHRPVLVELADGEEPARNMRPEFDKPKKPKTNFQKKQSDTTRPASGEKKDPDKRAADQ